MLILVIAMRSRRGVAVGVLISSTLLWPEYLRIPLVGIQFSAPRIIALALFYKYYLGEKKSRRQYNEIDCLIIIGFCWDIFANIVSGAGEARIKWLVGQGLDTVLIYFSVRYAVRSKADLNDLIKPILFCGIIMGLFGLYEAITFHSPYQKLLQYHQWMWYGKELEFRLGFLRAQASTAHPIYFGMSMFLLLGLIISVRAFKVNKMLYRLGFLGALFGALSTLSAGPMTAAILLLLFNAFYFKQGLIRPVIYMGILALIIIEIFSNRHFYSLIDYISISSNSWYRTRLLEVAVNQWHEYWLFGFGGNTPHHWGALLDGRKHVDLVNNYIVAAVIGGFPAVFILFRIHYLIITKALVIWRGDDEQLKVYAFGIACLMIALMLGSMSVGLFASALILSYAFYAAISWVDNFK